MSYVLYKWSKKRRKRRKRAGTTLQVENHYFRKCGKNSLDFMLSLSPPDYKQNYFFLPELYLKIVANKAIVMYMANVSHRNKQLNTVLNI